MKKHEEEQEAVRRLHEAAVEGNVASLIQLLHEHPLLLDQIIVDHSDSETPLHVAAILGHIDFAREILSRNSELALELDSKRRTPLHLASAKGYVEIVQMLLSEVQPERICKLRDEFGRTPLHVAAMKGQDELLKDLLCANIEATRVLTHRGESVLHIAVKHNRLDTLKLLLDSAEVSELLDWKDADGNTILHLAVAHKQTETVKYLVGGSAFGVKINAPNENGLTPLDVALALKTQSDFRDAEIIELLGDNKGVRGLLPGVTTAATTTKISNNNNGKKKKKKTDDWVNEMRSGLMVVASLIATVAFQAGLTPAGGLWQDTVNSKGKQPGHFAGQSIMGSTNKQHYRLYLVFNTVSFISSLSIILLLISGFPLKKRLFMWTLMIIMWIACTSMALSYSLSILFEVPNLTNFEDNLTNYSVLGLGLLLGIVLLGNFLRLVVWSVRHQTEVKEVIMTKLGKSKKVVMKMSNILKGRRGESTSVDESLARGV